MHIPGLIMHIAVVYYCLLIKSQTSKQRLVSWILNMWLFHPFHSTEKKAANRFRDKDKRLSDQEYFVGGSFTSSHPVIASLMNYMSFVASKHLHQSSPSCTTPNLGFVGNVLNPKLRTKCDKQVVCIHFKGVTSWWI